MNEIAEASSRTVLVKDTSRKSFAVAMKHRTAEWKEYKCETNKDAKRLKARLIEAFNADGFRVLHEQ